MNLGIRVGAPARDNLEQSREVWHSSGDGVRRPSRIARTIQDARWFRGRYERGNDRRGIRLDKRVALAQVLGRLDVDHDDRPAGRPRPPDYSLAVRRHAKDEQGAPLPR